MENQLLKVMKMTNMRIKQNQRYACRSSQRPLRKEGTPVSPVPVWI